MRWISDRIEQVTEIIQAITLVVRKSAAFAWSRVLLMAIVGIVTMGVPLIYTNQLVTDYIKSSNAELDNDSLASQVMNYQRALDYIQLCIDSSGTDDINKDYYCKNALTLFKDTDINRPKNQVNEIIERAAYGAMKAEVADSLRSVAQKRVQHKPATMGTFLEFMFPWGVWLVCIVGPLLMITCFFMTYRIARSTEQLNYGKRTTLAP